LRLNVFRRGLADHGIIICLKLKLLGEVLRLGNVSQVSLRFRLLGRVWELDVLKIRRDNGRFIH
jgi:hypothetical protein